jgi:hypothetical protein
MPKSDSVSPDTEAYIESDIEKEKIRQDAETERAKIQAEAAVEISENYAEAAEAAADAAKTEAELDVVDHELHEEKEEKEHKDVEKAEEEAEVVKVEVNRIPTEDRNEHESQPTPTDSQIADAEIVKDRAPRQTHRWWR